jgi:uncharacterized protein YaiI (UPF0178 family)
MKIWVDADACPKIIRDIIIRAAVKLQVETIFVANKYLVLPESEFLKGKIVSAGPDEADSFIATEAEIYDLAVTQDIPLASKLVTKGVVTINPRGTLYNENNIGERLSVRNLMHDLREGGMITGGPPPIGTKDRQKFADTFNRELTRLLKGKKL